MYVNGFTVEKFERVKFYGPSKSHIIALLRKNSVYIIETLLIIVIYIPLYLLMYLQCTNNMFRKIYLLGVLIFVSIYFLGNVEAGCNGSCEVVEGQDWDCKLDTHMWDEDKLLNNLNVKKWSFFKT